MTPVKRPRKSQKSTENNHRTVVFGSAIIALIVLIWAASPFVIGYRFASDITEGGAIGDMFGAVNALFSGLAFAFVIYAIFLQKKDLELQREELRLTRTELSISAKAHSNSQVFAALATLSSRWNSLPMFQARQLVATRFKEEEKVPEGVWEIIGEFFEHLGACLRAEAIAADLVWDTYTWYIENYWCIIQPTVQELRQEDDDPTYYERFEELFLEMLKISKKRLGADYNRPCEELKRFCSDEIALATAGIGISTKAASAPVKPVDKKGNVRGRGRSSFGGI